MKDLFRRFDNVSNKRNKSYMVQAGRTLSDREIETYISMYNDPDITDPISLAMAIDSARHIPVVYISEDDDQCRNCYKIKYITRGGKFIFYAAPLAKPIKQPLLRRLFKI